MLSKSNNTNKNKSLISFCVGGACGLGAALAFSAAVALALTGGALGQYTDQECASLAQHLATCESAATRGQTSNAGLQACSDALADTEMPDDARARVYINRSAIHLNRGNIDQALGDLRASEGYEDEDIPEASLNLSAAYLNQRNYAAAITAANQAISEGLSQPELAYFNIAIAYERQGRFEEAYNQYVRAANMDPGNATLQAQPRRFPQHRQR